MNREGRYIGGGQDTSAFAGVWVSLETNNISTLTCDHGTVAG